MDWIEYPLKQEKCYPKKFKKCKFQIITLKEKKVEKNNFRFTSHFSNYTFIVSFLVPNSNQKYFQIPKFTNGKTSLNLTLFGDEISTLATQF